MAEMQLFIKPVFAKESVDRFADDVEKQLGKGGGGGTDDAKKEQKKQTGILEQISRFTKIAAGAGVVATGLSLLPGAVNLGKAIGDTRENRLERAFRGGENYDEGVADAIEQGKDLNEVLSEEMIIQEALDQAKRRATAELEGNTAAAEDSTKTLQDLLSVFLDLGGTVDDFNDKVATLAAKSWVDGESTAEEVDKIDEAFDGTKEKIEEVATGVNEFAKDTETKSQEINDNVDNLVGAALDRVEVQLAALPNAFNEVPLIKAFRGIVDVLKEVNDLLTDISKFDFGELISGMRDIAGGIPGVGGIVARGAFSYIDNKKAGDTVK